MDDAGCTSPQPWRVVAEEASREYDPRKLLELIEELGRRFHGQRYHDWISQPAMRLIAERGEVE